MVINCVIFPRIFPTHFHAKLSDLWFNPAWPIFLISPLSILLCLQHVGRDAARRAGSSATADTCLTCMSLCLWVPGGRRLCASSVHCVCPGKQEVAATWEALRSTCLLNCNNLAFTQCASDVTGRMMTSHVVNGSACNDVTTYVTIPYPGAFPMAYSGIYTRSCQNWT